MQDALANQDKIDHVVQAITMVTDNYSNKTIEKETISVLKTKAGAVMTGKELTRKVMERLGNKTSDKRPHAKKAPKELDEEHIAMLNFIENEELEEF